MPDLSFTADTNVLFLTTPSTGRIVGVATGTLYNMGLLEIEAVRFMPHPTNSGTVYLFTTGSPQVGGGVAIGGFPIPPGATNTFIVNAVANLNQFQMMTDKAGDSLCYLAESGLGDFNPRQNRQGT